METIQVSPTIRTIYPGVISCSKIYEWLAQILFDTNIDLFRMPERSIEISIDEELDRFLNPMWYDRNEHTRRKKVHITGIGFDDERTCTVHARFLTEELAVFPVTITIEDFRVTALRPMTMTYDLSYFDE